MLCQTQVQCTVNMEIYPLLEASCVHVSVFGLIWQKVQSKTKTQRGESLNDKQDSILFN